MNNNNRISYIYSWPIIIISLPIWPLTIFLIYRRCKLDKQAVQTMGKLIGIIGYLLAALYLFCTIIIIAAPDVDLTFSDFIVLSFIGFPGIAMIIYSIILKKQDKRYKEYLAIIIEENERDLRNISSILNRPFEMVKKDVAKMIHKEYFNKAYIDNNTHLIHFKNPEMAQEKSNTQQNAAFYSNNNSQSHVPPIQQGHSNPQPARMVICKYCGAKNVSSGGECEYCGTHLLM